LVDCALLGALLERAAPAHGRSCGCGGLGGSFALDAGCALALCSRPSQPRSAPIEPALCALAASGSALTKAIVAKAAVLCPSFIGALNDGQCTPYWVAMRT
jgi:hypothetical protein